MSLKGKYKASREGTGDFLRKEAAAQGKNESCKNAGSSLSSVIQAILRILDLGLNAYSLLMKFIFTVIFFALLIYLWP